MAYVNDINEEDYREQLADLRKYYGYKDSQGNPIVTVDEKNHTIKLNKNTNPILAEYILSCINVLLDINKACTKISSEVWFRRKESGAIDAIKAYNNFARTYNTLGDDKNYQELKKRVTSHKEDITLPDFKYFFETAAYQSYTTEDQAKLTDELTKAMSDTVLQNNLQLDKNKGGK